MNGPQSETHGNAPTVGEALQRASDLDEGYTSSSAPDAQSISLRHAVFGDTAANSPSRPATPRSTLLHTQPPSRPFSIFTSGQVSLDPSVPGDDVWPVEIMDEYIMAFKDRYMTANDSRDFEEAEKQLIQAILYSELRLAYYLIPFSDRLQLQEAIAPLHQAQGRYSDAVRHVTELLSNPQSTVTDGAGHVEARQNQLLAEIYLDRHLNNDTGRSLNDSFSDIAMAEEHAKKAFNLRSDYIKAEDEKFKKEQAEDQQTACMKLLVAIFGEVGKSVQRDVFERRLVNRGSISSGDTSLRIFPTRESRSSLPVPAVEEEAPVQPSSIFEAIHTGSLEEVQRYLQDHPHLDLQLMCAKSKTPLIHAVESADKSVETRAILARLLDPALGINLDLATPSKGTALQLAAELGSLYAIDLLISASAHINLKDWRGETPIFRAVFAGHADAVRLLYVRNADLSVKSLKSEWNLLHFSVHQKVAPVRQQLAVTECLLEINPSLKDEFDFNDRTALSYCAEHCFVEHSTLLLVHGADVNKADCVHRTPLWFAANRPKTAARNALVDSLIEHGAELDPKRSLPKHAKDYPSLRPQLEPNGPPTRVRRRTWFRGS